MGFTGNLQTLPISEVLTLLMTSGKTGILNCSLDTNFAKFIFYKGKLIKFEINEPSLYFGTLLVKRGTITHQDLSYSLQLQNDVGKRIGEILVDLKMLTPNQVIATVRYQLEETFFYIVEWGGGLFSFDEVHPQELAEFSQSPYTEIDLLALLKEFAEKSKEFKALADQLPSDASKLSLFVRPEELESDITGNRQIMEIIHLADGTRTLKDIRRACSLGIIQAQRLIFSLYLKDIIKSVSTSGTISHKKVYETIEQEAMGIAELFNHIFPPCFKEIQELYVSKMGIKATQIIDNTLAKIIKKYPELFPNIKIKSLEDLDINLVFKKINIRYESGWFHTIFSMFSELLSELLHRVKGVLGKVQVDRLINTFSQRIELHLEESRQLTDKYNLEQSLERLLKEFKS